MAFVASRTSRLELLVDSGDRRAALVLSQKEESADFLAMVQIGITFVATLASAVGGATIANQLSPYLEPIFGRTAYQVTLTLIVIGLTYLSLVVGELVPKQMALHHPESLIIRIIKPLSLFRRAVWLPIRILDRSSTAILRLLGFNGQIAEGVSAEEVRLIVDSAVTDGEISTTEQLLINQVFNFSTRSLAEVMTPRPSIVAINDACTVAEALQTVQTSGFSRLPVIEDGLLDSAKGYLHVKDLIQRDDNDGIRACVRDIMYLPDSLELPVAFKRLTQSETHLALVIDEFGGVSGIVTMEDMLEEIVGEIEDEYGEALPTARQTEQNRWQVDGSLPVHEFTVLVGMALPENPRRYTTVGGYLIAQLGDLPKTGQQLKTDQLRFTIKQLDRHRIAQVIVERRN